VFLSRSNSAIAAGVFTAVFLWGANNAGVKFLVAHWPPVWIGCSRMFCVAAILLGLLRWTNWFGPNVPLTPEHRRTLWRVGGTSLALYVMLFTFSLKFTSASNVALCLGTSPVWATLLEGRPALNRESLKRYAAVLLAVSGVLVLFWPNLKLGPVHLQGGGLALGASLIWTRYSRTCRALGATLSGAEITAHTMWRAATLLAPLAVIEVFLCGGIVWRLDVVAIQLYCVVCGGVVSFALWNNALKHWPASKVLLAGNLIPVTTMGWAHFCLGEPVTPTFWLATALIVGGVALGQANWEKIFGNRWLPSE